MTMKPLTKDDIKKTFRRMEETNDCSWTELCILTTQEIARPLQAEIDELIEIIQDLLTVIHDHHSDNVMREDRHICPVCTDKESVKIIQRAMQKRYELA